MLVAVTSNLLVTESESGGSIGDSRQLAPALAPALAPESYK